MKELHLLADVDNWITPLEPIGKNRKQVEEITEEHINQIYEAMTNPKVKIIKKFAFCNVLEKPGWLTDHLYALGFRIIHTPSINGMGDNVDDVEINTAIQEAIDSKSILGIGALTADKHFIASARKCRECGKEFILFSSQKANWALVKIASRYIPLSTPYLLIDNGKETEGDADKENFMDIAEILKARKGEVERPTLMKSLIQNGIEPRRAKNYIDESIAAQVVEEITRQNGSHSEQIIRLANRNE
jgi:hypothetical protein